MGQMANLLIERQQGSFPSNLEINPRGEGKKRVKAITLRSGRELATSGQPPVGREVETESYKADIWGSTPTKQIQWEAPRDSERG